MTITKQELLDLNPRLTLQEIGVMFGVSRQRVRQMYAKYGMEKPRGENTMRRKAREKRTTCECGKRKTRASIQCQKCYGLSQRRTSKVIDARGYVRLPRYLRKGKNVYEHRQVAAQKIGRPLRDDEDVHFINGVRHDTRPENLQVVTRKEHMAIDKRLACRVKLTPEQAETIRDAYAKGDATYAALAEEYDVSAQVISSVIHRRGAYRL